MQDDEDDLTRIGNNIGILRFVEERDPTPLGKYSFTGKNDCVLLYWFRMIVSWIHLLTSHTGMTLERMTGKLKLSIG